MFNQKDYQQFIKKGISKETVEQQITNFIKGFPFINIIKPATIKNGIVKLTSDQIDNFIKIYLSALKSEKIIKFVPASGAASRMFKDLFEFIDHNGIEVDKNFHSVNEFFRDIQKFAFYDDLQKNCQIELNSESNKKQIIKCLLEENGLNYSSLPKGLIKFHKYKDHSRTSIEEHLVEGAEYATSNKLVNIHFTISPEHIDLFNDKLKYIVKIYEGELNVKFNIDLSVQKVSTDTIAVDLKNNPFRNDKGEIVFRPGGHGALIENLNDLDADIIFVKNIDNVVPERLKDDTILYKKAIAGNLIVLRNEIFNHLSALEKEPSEELVSEVKQFLEKELFIETDRHFTDRSFQEKVNYLSRKLNRPIRVCGMVKNQGEPGGGPFFVQKESGSVSLQIVEGAQIDMNDPVKQKIVSESTHFNPVDLVLSVKNYKGESFDLKEYVDPQTGFISIKSFDGKDLKAQELPGLWNGAMANWITVFVEVPISTFNPVKVVNDLLRENHQ